MKYRREASLLILVAVLSLLATLFDGSFVRDNTLDILINSIPTMIISCGVMLVIITGEIDISVGSLLGLLAAILALLCSTVSPGLGIHPYLAIPIVLTIGTLIGLGTGCLVVYGRVPSIIATLGLLIALDGAQDWLMGGGDIKHFPQQLRNLGTGTKLPINLIFTILVVVATGLLCRKTALGRRIYAVGSNRSAARLAGISEAKIKLFVFALTGLLTAMAATLWVAKLGNVSTSTGAGLELKVVTCVVVGGIAIRGGRGRLLGVVLAVILITMIRTVLNFMDLGSEAVKWQRAIEGVMILVAVTSDHFSQRQQSGGSS
ncbi:MAG: ABC transporter permease [Rubripirellula sp.]|nr:ABC transporter permease [Rubripirellula sp.]